MAWEIAHRRHTTDEIPAILCPVTTRDDLKISASRLLQKQRFNRLFASRIVHLTGAPMLNDIFTQSALMTTSAREAAEAVLGDSADYAEEFAGVRQQLVAADAENIYPEEYGVEEGTALLLYSLIRHARPSVVLEVGVANGRSTMVILSALDANAHGRLVSVDITPDVAAPAHGHPRWSLRVHQGGKASTRELGELFDELGAVDVFFHDAGHRYYEQYGDYVVGCDRLRSGGLFVSDDIDMSFAFLDIARRANVKPVALTDRRKVVGAFRRP
jgi:predicted O-methyltransferase YrrM